MRWLVAYGEVIDQLFFQPEERQREIEALCDGSFPAFGYAVLSGMMTLDGGRCNVALTTNFDDLIADALFYSRRRDH
jgi:protein O-mannosyl-transferase